MLVECPHCRAIVDGQIIGSYDDYEEESGVTGTYSFLKCPICAAPFIMLQIDSSEWDEPTRLYPPTEMGISPAIPGSLRSAYAEAQLCFGAKAYTATAMMCRKTLQGIAEEQKVTARNLASALKEMTEKGVIENRLYEWADALRLAGNEAAHDLSTNISHQDAKDILDFTKALLEYVFTFQERFEQFKKRRGHSKVAA